MKTLKNYIEYALNEEVGAGFTTPANTAGMGNPMAPGGIGGGGADLHDNTNCGSGDVPNAGQKHDNGEPPAIEELPDGTYEGKRWAYRFMVDDGRLFKTKQGIRNDEKHAIKAVAIIKDGKCVFERNQ